MSKVYRIQLKSQVSRQISSSDEITYPIELNQLLPEDDMLTLLQQALLDHGWEQHSAHQLTKTGSVGEVITIDLDQKVVHVHLEETKQVKKDIEVDYHVDAENRQDAQRHGKRRLHEHEKNANQQLDQLSDQLQSELSQKLIDSEAQRQQSIHEVLQQTYAEALKRKAAQLGEITSIQESTNDNGEFELVIKVSQ